MNFVTAGIAAGSFFVLSLLAGALGGVPLFDMALRAFFWAAVGFGGSLGVEAVLRSLIPDLFGPSDPRNSTDDEPGDSEPQPRRTVDIVVEDDGSEAVQASEKPADEAPPPPARPAEETAAPAEPAAENEEMPEIGSFLEAFKPAAAEPVSGEGPAPDVGEYSPGEASLARASEVTIDGEAQDPAILAKAVQTVMKRDGQGT